MPSGNLNLPQVGKKGDEMEFLARNYLKKQGYQIIHGGIITKNMEKLSLENTGRKKNRKNGNM